MKEYGLKHAKVCKATSASRQLLKDARMSRKAPNQSKIQLARMDIAIDRRFVDARLDAGVSASERTVVAISTRRDGASFSNDQLFNPKVIAS